MYAAANLGAPSHYFGEDEFLFLDPNAPARTLSGDHHIWPASCTAGGENIQVRVRDGALIPSGSASYQPNNTGGAILHADPNIVQEFLASCRNNGTGTLYAGWIFNPDCRLDLRGSGLGTYCAHGGSGLSATAGSLRVWEMAAGVPIQHVLKATLPASTLSNDQVGVCDGGYRWPAIIADAGWQSSYTGSVPSLCMGALLVLPPNVDCATFSADFSRRICTALKTYGVRVVDIHPSGPNWRPFTINQEIGVSVNGSHIIQMFQMLQVVTNDGQSSPGGPGTRLAPPLPPIGN